MSYLNGHKLHVSNQMGALASARWGTVTSYNPKTHMVKLQWETDENPDDGQMPVSQWLPITCASTGAGTSFRVAPTAGQQAFAVPQEFHNDAYVVVGFAHSDQNPPPAAPEAIGGDPVDQREGEIIIQTGGVTFRISNDHVYIKGPISIEGDLTIKGNTAQTGTITATGDVKSSGGNVIDNHNSMAHLRSTVNTHTHSGVQTGGGNTGGTNQTD